MQTDSSNAGCTAMSPQGSAEGAAATPSKPSLAKYLLLGVLLAAAWWLVYRSLQPLSVWLTYVVCGLPHDSTI